MKGGGIRLLDSEDHHEVKHLNAHEDSIWSLDFSKDGKFLASAGLQDGTAKIWKMPKGELVANLEHGDWVTSVSFSTDGRQLATGCRDSKVRIWDVQKAELITALSGHDGGIITLKFSNDSKLLASGGWDQTLIIWDMETQTIRARFDDYSSDITAIAFSPDDSIIATGVGSDFWIATDHNAVPEFSVTLRRSSDGEIIRHLLGHSGRIEGLAFSADGKRIISGAGSMGMLDQSPDGIIRVWKVSNGGRIKLLRPGKELQQMLLLLCGLGLVVWLFLWIRAIRQKKIPKPYRTIFIAVLLLVMIFVAYAGTLYLKFFHM